jgi:hypothetical protein
MFRYSCRTKGKKHRNIGPIKLSDFDYRIIKLGIRCTDSFRQNKIYRPKHQQIFRHFNDISKIFLTIHGLLPSVMLLASILLMDGFPDVAVASIPAATDPAVADDLAALTDVSAIAGVPAAASFIDNCRYRRLGCCWHTGYCLPFANVPVDGFPNVAGNPAHCYSVSAVARILAVTEVPFVVVFPSVPDVSTIVGVPSVTSLLLPLSC